MIALPFRRHLAPPPAVRPASVLQARSEKILAGMPRKGSAAAKWVVWRMGGEAVLTVRSSL